MKKIVIIGGGFAGSYCAKNLEKDFDVTLIDTKNFFEFTPSVLRVLVEPEHLKEIQILHKDYLRNTKFVHGNVDKISNESVFVANKKYDYNYLIITSGSSYTSPFKKENVIHPNRGIELKNYAKELEKSKKILIVGGGLVGVELAGEIVDKYPEKRIELIQKNERLIPRNNCKSSLKIEKYLENKVRLRFGEIFKKSQENDYDIIFFCTGIKPNSHFIKAGFETDNFLRFNGKENIFVGGDVSGIKEEKTAQNAIKQAKVIVENIYRMEKGKKLKEYKLKKRILLISLGKKRGVLEWKDFVWFGIIPARIKDFVERRHMKLMRKH